MPGPSSSTARVLPVLRREREHDAHARRRGVVPEVPPAARDSGRRRTRPRRPRSSRSRAAAVPHRLPRRAPRRPVDLVALVRSAPCSRRASSNRSSTIACSRTLSAVTVIASSRTSVVSGCATATSACCRIEATGERSSCAASETNRRCRSCAARTGPSVTPAIHHVTSATTSSTAGTPIRMPGPRKPARPACRRDPARRRPSAPLRLPSRSGA